MKIWVKGALTVKVMVTNFFLFKMCQHGQLPGNIYIYDQLKHDFVYRYINWERPNNTTLETAFIVKKICKEQYLACKTMIIWTTKYRYIWAYPGGKK